MSPDPFPIVSSMMVPLTPEEQWLSVLAHSPVWQPQIQHMVVIAPHPDDETLGCGGLICKLRQMGRDVTVIAVTDGENCYPGEELGATRTGEQAAALERLGVRSTAIHRLHFPDSGLGHHEEALYQAMAPLLPSNAHLVAPWEHDFHPDHEVCGRAASRLADTLSLRLSSYFFWTWHRAAPALLRDLPLLRLPLTSSEQTAKREALECHRSQLEHPSGEPILPISLLQPAWRGFEVYLPA